MRLFFWDETEVELLMNFNTTLAKMNRKTCIINAACYVINRFGKKMFALLTMNLLGQEN